jgi:NAD(P)-dependent dehydrogenase (short-subunit alcohol dehydrogenase family)
VERASRTGCHLVLVGRDRGALAATCARALSAGAGSAHLQALDVSDDEAVAALVQGILERRGRLDAVVHAAGVVAYGRTEQVPREVFDAVVGTNLLGSVNLARHVVPVLRQQGRGHLVLLGSVLGHLAVPGMTAYVVSKWGVRALARQLQLENRDCAHVHISYVAPGGVDTPIYQTAANYLGWQGRPPPPVTTAEDVADVVLRVLERPRHRRQVGVANDLMRFGFSAMPAVYDALVGPLFGVAALDRSRPVSPGPGNVLAALPGTHAVRGTLGGSLGYLLRNLPRVRGTGKNP